MPGTGPVGVDVCYPEDVYDEVRGTPPDLLVYFGDLRWRSAGTVGHPGLFLEENDTGPDDAVHSWDGILVLSGPGLKAGGAISASKIRDVAPTILWILGVDAPKTMQGRPIGAIVGRHHPAPKSD